MPDWKTVLSYETEYPADSVEWCPCAPYFNYFVCGTYFLLEDQKPDIIQERIGSICLMEVNECDCVTLLEKVSCFGVLDMKWCEQLVNGNIVLGAVTAKGDVDVYRLVDDHLELLSSVNLRSDEEGDYMTLAVNWSIAGEVLCVTDNKGNVGVLKLVKNQLQILNKWKGHDLEAWTAVFAFENSNILFTGGDDAKLKIWDRRSSATPMTSSAFHDSGVTIIQPRAENALLVGSFDEYLNLFDPRKFRTPVKQVKCSGGLWRVKCRGKYALTANIYGGFQIIDLDMFNVVDHYKEHGSLAYGADWSWADETKLTESGGVRTRFLLGTCSFYDRKLNLSRWDPEHIS